MAKVVLRLYRKWTKVSLLLIYAQEMTMNMTFAQIAELVSKQADLKVEGLTIPVKLLAVKNVFGKVIYTVTPLHGSGTLNVHADRITIKE
jgi:hypothetical protein